uniref:Uncharacterized protein n=1 Tax=Corethron hystrix TaxID=216773 RepID=A0A7S1BT48_9STRA|eukprot:CAMPEP_0113310728 /NCGR_PEP_ID=MMETSP0010_2-20120614/8258_1 /TAXON_ID=216773 ORGANISM="Corethron hystrix, Strain 308" /NCGR_SAMPLE_ID=MMETSP0010_2 /ASSEMBLY_ACC=CAM_ASM_000155 /LENGTH=205 /DNA_ID=CAMNT_0000166243 /DNA_START=80 /DNA_END=697 /DNA_ORIENTATION=+ /assembly_acc=CAM_ASM_000155
MAILCQNRANSFIISPSQRNIFSSHRASITFRKSKCNVRRSASASGTSSRVLYMKDSSCAYWFNVGDKVTVQSSVEKAGIELKGRTGVVTETWQKCEVDPTCCCAEYVDDNYAVTVKFQGKLDALISDDGGGDSFFKGNDTFTHYFNEDELLKIEKEENISSAAQGENVAFDGMSCTAFKLDQLKMGKQAQRIAAFEAAQSKEAS